jgi:hypothetical protein
MLLNAPMVRSALAQPETAPAATAPTATPSAAKEFDPMAACASFVAAELSGKPLPSSKLPVDVQDQIRSWMEQLVVCRAFVAKSDEPCMALATAARQNQCKSSVAKEREMWKLPPETIGRTMYSAGLYRMCKSDRSETECRALERAVQEGDPKSCSAMGLPALKQICTAWALGDPTKCDAKDEECKGAATLIRKISKEGPSVLPSAQNPESRLLHDITLGRSKVGCDGLIDVVKADCTEKTREALRAKSGAAEASTPTVSAPTMGMPTMPTPSVPLVPGAATPK